MPSIKPFLFILILTSAVALPLSSNDSTQCQSGKAQSPIYIDPSNTTYVSYQKFSMSSDYRRSINVDLLVEVNKTLSLTVATAESRILTIAGGCLTGEFTFRSAHLHWPQSEHRFAKDQFTMEAHFVHKNFRTNQTAVFAYFFQPLNQSESNEEESADGDWNGIIERMNKTSRILLKDGLVSLMQGNINRFLHYQGSLTASPCTEGVLWVLVSSRIQLSVRSLQQLQQKIIASNYRPAQALNGRIVTRSFPSTSSLW